MRLPIALFIIYCCCSKSGNGAKILGVVPFGTSHYILGNKLMKVLANAGHDVTVISPYEDKIPPKNGSYTNVIISGFDESYQEMKKNLNMFETANTNALGRMVTMVQHFSRFVNLTLFDPGVRRLLNSDAKFDAVVMEQFFLTDAYKIFPYKFQCPLIVLASVGPGIMINSVVGNPTMFSYDSSFIDIKGTKMTFKEKLANFFIYLTFSLGTTFYMMPLQNDLLHQAVPDAPDILDIHKNISLVLLNSHTSTRLAVPVVPNMVEVGGYHIDPPKKLPKDLQELLDNATNGVVYFSMGSNLESKDLPKEKRDVFLNVFGRLKEKVLWKFEDEVLPGQPDNVIIRKWLPQQDILAHPNVKLFITHGGMLSSTEAIYHGVPTLAIPVFGDQFANADKAVRGGYALKLSYKDKNFTEDHLEEVIGELLTNPKYTNTVKQKSKLFHDRPMSPAQTIAYWVDYVIRHKGAEHLRVKGINMPFYEYYLLDVLFFVSAVVCLVIYVVRFAIRKLCLCCRRKQVKLKQN